MIFGFVMLAVAVTISLVAAYYSIMGLTAIFAAAVVPIIIMGSALELGKVVSTVWLHNNWARVPRLFKLYLIPAVAFLMFLTSMGIFGFLSKAHSDQSLVSGDVQAKIAIYDEKIKTARENIEADRRSLQQMDAAVDQTLGRSTDEKGADKAVAVRRSQAKERARLQSEIETEQKKIAALNEEAAPIRAEVRKVEAEVGPIKYIAALLYGDNVDANLLEQAVRWVIILIVVVFDPLALTLILASNKQFEWALRGEGGWVHDQPRPREPFDFKEFVARLKGRFKRKKTVDELVEDITPENAHPEVDFNQLGIDQYIENANKELEDAREEPAVPYVVVEDADTEEPQRQDGFSAMPPFVGSTFQYTSKPKKKKSTPKKKIKVAEPEFESPNAPGLDASVERPGDYLTPPETAPRFKVEVETPPETAPRFKASPDNIELSNPANSGFGTEFPNESIKGDTYLRVDYLPSRLYKFNGIKWIEVDKNSTDSYAYNDQYIDHLIAKIDAGEYSIDDLNDVEKELIEQKLKK